MHSPLILIDGSSYFFRAFHALPPLTNSKGQPTGAIYGVANMIKKLIKDYQPEHIAVVFDAKGKTFRDDLYPHYKAHRPPTPPDLSSQFHPLMDILSALGLPLLIIDGVEADDVIGTLARLAGEQGQSVVISTGDKDMAQLVNAQVSLINTMSNTAMDIEGVKAKFGVRPEQIIDYLALIGDSVDNVPGVNKCGPKTAVKWLDEYQSLDNLLLNKEAIGGKIGKNLRESADFLPLARQLVTIKTDVELPLTLSDLRPQKPDQEKLIKLTTEYEFKTWLKELLGQPSLDTAIPASTRNFETITTEEQLNPWINKLEACSAFCINPETTHQDPMSGKIVGISLAIEGDTIAGYIPLAHNDGSLQLPTEKVFTALKPLLENPQIKKIGQNLKHDFHSFKNHGITLQGMTFDTMLESYVLNSIGNRHDLESLALKYLGIKIAGKGVKQVNFDAIPVIKAAPYASEIAAVILELHQKLFSLMDSTLQHVFHTIEMPLLNVLAEMERGGVSIDDQVLGKHGERLKARILTLEQEAIALAGKPFNLLSPKQVQTILFEELKIPVISKTPTGQASTSESVLQELAFDYRLPAVILEYRGLTKLVSTYIDALPKKINSETQRVHTSYNQAVAATGRLSSSDPNLQNIPIRNEEGRLFTN
jgi:DNA polymerase-1